MKTPARRRVGLLLASLCLPLFAQAAETQPTHEFSLDNGLKVIVLSLIHIWVTMPSLPMPLRVSR